jgi:hypothetical protein
MINRILAIFILFLFLKSACFGYTVWDTENSIFSVDAYLRTDLVSFKNVVSLNSANKDDRSTYLGIDYSLGFQSKFKNDGPILYLKLERNGPYDYNAPLFIHNTLMAAGSHIDAYRNEELLPQVEEFWMDSPIPKTPLRFKTGMFPYEVGKGYAQGSGSYENYGFSLYKPGEDLNWRFHYYRPDFVYKNILGPKIEQEKEEGITYEPNAANYFAFDAEFSLGQNSFQPFIGLLLDRTSSGKRYNLFAAPVHEEILGTLGLDYDVTIKDLTLGFEVARNFGKAQSESAEFKDIEHKGYLIYTKASYKIGKFSPHAQFLYSSGNKVTTDMVNNGDTEFLSAANKAFSVYSPLNTNLFDSHSPTADSLPLVFCGWGYGLNYGVGINRPSTLSDDSVLDNLVMPSLGFDYNFTEKLNATFDWWYLRANERGVGTYEGIARYLSRDLGQELDLSFYYEINDHLNLSLCGGYFFPGKYFKEKRDDTAGSLFTPFVRGDGKADGAYQIELSAEFKF